MTYKALAVPRFELQSCGIRHHILW